ncbi:hypothetical protein Bca4012_054759 [Brassica carinata]
MAQPPPVSESVLEPNSGVHVRQKKQCTLYISILGLSQISEPVDFQIGNGTTMGGFVLSLHKQVLRQYVEPENTRSNDSSPQHLTYYYKIFENFLSYTETAPLCGV